MSGELTARVAALCDDVLQRLVPGEASRLVGNVRAKLAEPLSVAVAGGVSSGKSTLVNALLGQQIAAVDAGECTRLVTWFRYDHRERIELRMHDGSVRPLAFAEGRRVPSSVGADPDQVAGLDVYLSNSGLKDLSIIDTPGLNTVTAANEATSRAFLGLGEAADSEAQLAMSRADALLFLTPQLRQADADMLSGFRELSRGSDLTALNTVGVLSKVDKLAGPGEDPLEIGARLAKRAETELQGLVSRVHPVIGLLAETAGADAFTEADARTVAELAALDEMDVEDLLLSTGDLLDTDWAGTTRERRARLLAMLDLYGLAVAIDVVRQGGRGSAPILTELERRSGFGALRSTLVGHFGRRADQLKAHAGICDLRRISFLRGEPKNLRVLRGLRAPLEDLELDREIQALRVLDALRAYQVGELPLPAEHAAQLEQLADGDDPATRLGLPRTASAAERAARARDRAVLWGTFGNDIRRSPGEARLAREVKQCFELLWADATANQQGAAP